MENQDLEQIQYVCLIKILDYITAVALFILTKYSLLPVTTQLLLHRKGLPLKNFNSRTPASSCFRLRWFEYAHEQRKFCRGNHLKGAIALDPIQELKRQKQSPGNILQKSCNN